MKLNGNSVALTIAGLALVVATTGTAYAVTSTQVNIADPARPANIAHVDGAGRLFIINPRSTINSVVNAQATFEFDTALNPLTDPTTATLAVTSYIIDNVNNEGSPNTDWDTRLVKVIVGSSGTCNDSDATAVILRNQSVAAGQSTIVDLDSPIQLAPVNNKPYCIGMLVYPIAFHTQPTSYVPPVVSVSAYVVTGTYHGTGLATAARPRTLKPQLVHVKK